MTARNPRICADCRHCEVRRAMIIVAEEFCRHPRAVDLVTGKAVWRARQLRDPGSRLCGAAGRLWEAQEAVATPTPATPLRPPAYPLTAAALKVQQDRAQDEATKQYHAYLGSLLPEDALDVVRGEAPDPVDVAVGDPVALVRPFAKAVREGRR